MSSEKLDPVWDAPLDPAEFARREAASVASVMGPDGEEMRALHAWFIRRYPTPLERLKYIRKQTESIAATGRKRPAT